MDKGIAQDLAKLRKCVVAGQYKKAEAIVDGLGKGLTTNKAKKKRFKIIRRHLKETGDNWFLTVLYLKRCVERDNFIAAVLFGAILADNRRYPKKGKQITRAMVKLIGPDMVRLSQFQEGGWDWELLHWTD
jgi:hypothetical protein